MIGHEEASELLELLALDAVDEPLAREVEEHVSGCVRCQSELDAYRHVAATLGNSVEPLPDSLWDSIALRLGERPAPTAVPMPSLGSEPAESMVTPIAVGRPSWSHRTRNTIAAAAMSAAAAIIVLGVGWANANSRVAHLQGVLSQSSQTAVTSALETPGHYVVDLASKTGNDIAEFVMLPSGQGYLVSSTLPRLSSDKTYQLWGIVKGQPISLGVMGRSPRTVAFTMAGSVKPSVLAVTVEPSGGTSSPTTSPVASGAV